MAQQNIPYCFVLFHISFSTQHWIRRYLFNISINFTRILNLSYKHKQRFLGRYTGQWDIASVLALWTNNNSIFMYFYIEIYYSGSPSPTLCGGMCRKFTVIYEWFDFCKVLFRWMNDVEILVANTEQFHFFFIKFHWIYIFVDHIPAALLDYMPTTGTLFSMMANQLHSNSIQRE